MAPTFCLELRRSRWLPPSADTILRLEYHDGLWQRWNPSGDQEVVYLLGSSVVTRWMLCLHWRTVRGKKYDILLCDQCHPEEWRRVRIALRCAKL